MATVVDGNINSYTQSGYTFRWDTRVIYEVTSETDTDVTYSVRVQIYHINTDATKRVALNSGVTASLTIAGQVVETFRSTSSHTLYAGEANAWTVITKSVTIHKTHVQHYESLSATATLTNWGKGTSTYTNANALLVNAAPYTVTYNSNGGSGVIASQKKYVGTALTLSDGAGLTRQRYKLTGWNTAADGSGTHYELSGQYTTEADVTLYAEWTLDSIPFRVKINGAWKTGILKTKVNGAWVTPHAGYIKVNGQWKEITI